MSRADSNWPILGLLVLRRAEELTVSKSAKEVERWNIEAGHYHMVNAQIDVSEAP